MSERSAKWLKKRSFLDQREAVIKNELSEASETLEAGVKKVLIATVVVGAAFTTGYILFRAFRPKKSKKEPAALPQQDVAVSNTAMRAQSRPSSLKHALIEKITMYVVQIIGTQVALFLSKTKINEK